MDVMFFQSIAFNLKSFWIEQVWKIHFIDIDEKRNTKLRNVRKWEQKILNDRTIYYHLSRVIFTSSSHIIITTISDQFVIAKLIKTVMYIFVEIFTLFAFWEMRLANLKIDELLAIILSVTSRWRMASAAKL